jgi:Protein of unknown function (DUF3892)
VLQIGQIMPTARPVRQTGKNQGVITSLYDASWGKRLKADAIHDIESGTYTYYVPWTDMRTEVEVANANPKYLHTHRDNTTRNNLLDLPDAP